MKNYFCGLFIGFLVSNNLQASNQPEKFDVYKAALKMLEEQKEKFKTTYPHSALEPETQKISQSYFLNPLENMPACRMCEKETANLSIVPCGHTFGQRCLKENVGIVHCPECHTRIREFLIIYQ